MIDFLGIGAQKTGTTWLFENLRQHPQVAFPAGKEIHFWNQQYDKGVDWYLSLFPANLDQKQGEITPAYAFQPKDIIEQVYDINPSLRLFYCIRNPIERAWSSAMMALRRAEMTIEEASDQWFIDHFNSQGSLQRGDYVTCINNWLDIFPEDQLLVVSNQQISNDPMDVLVRCCDHIGVEPALFRAEHQEQVKKAVNKGQGHKIRESLLPILHELYDQKIEAIKAHPILGKVYE